MSLLKWNQFGVIVSTGIGSFRTQHLQIKVNIRVSGKNPNVSGLFHE